MKKLLFLKTFISHILKFINYKSLFKNLESLKVFDEKFDIIFSFIDILTCLIFCSIRYF